MATRHGMRSIVVALLVGPASGLRSIVRVTDAASRRPVVLIGTMHYNPASIAAVASTVRATAASTGGLHATAIELCPARWNTTMAKKFNRASSLKRLMAEDEFQVAFEAATDCGLSDVVLADQSIEVTGRRLGAALLQTCVDLVSGPAGWKRVQVDLLELLRQVPTFASAAADVGLLAGMPLAMVRYIYQSPAALPFLAVSTTTLLAAAAIDEATGALPAWEDGAFTLLLAIVLGRAVFVSLIDERNDVLARNIRDACMQPPEAQSMAIAEDPTATVIAVVGMAHLAGVRDALLRNGYSV